MSCKTSIVQLQPAIVSDNSRATNIDNMVLDILVIV